MSARILPLLVAPILFVLSTCRDSSSPSDLQLGMTYPEFKKMHPRSSALNGTLLDYPTGQPNEEQLRKDVKYYSTHTDSEGVEWAFGFNAHEIMIEIVTVRREELYPEP